MTLIPSTTAGGAEAIDLQPGTIVKCVTCYDKEITGEIAAFDINKKALVVGRFSTRTSHFHYILH